MALPPKGTMTATCALCDRPMTLEMRSSVVTTRPDGGSHLEVDVNWAPMRHHLLDHFGTPVRLPEDVMRAVAAKP